METGTDVSFAVSSLYEALLQVSDKRKARGKRYPLAALLTILVLGKLSGEDEIEGIAEWGRLRTSGLSAAFGLKRAGLPHPSTYRRVLNRAIDIAELERIVGDFLGRCRQSNGQLSIDGKIMRGTVTDDQRGVYLLAIYEPEAGVVLRQVEMGEKANELSGAPALLGQVDLSETVVTGDAMFTQRNLSEQVVASGGNYVWTVKANQPHLSADIVRLFGAERVPKGSAPLKTDFQTVQLCSKGHGRIEERTLTTSSLLKLTSDWPHLAQVFQLTRRVTHLKRRKVSVEVAYGLTSLSAVQAPPARLLDFVRSHWTIENRLHYCRDVTFREDACRLRQPQAAHAIAILNNLVSGLLRQFPFRSLPQARRFCAASLDHAFRFVFFPVP
jgi:predicted transposase YbfD/YdcC